MSLRFSVLGSGSAGNAIIVEGGSTRVLVDCGFSLRETGRRLGRLECHPESLSAVLLTHEHSDHASGVERFAAHHGLPIYATYGTLRASTKAGTCGLMQIDGHTRFRIGDLQITPYPVPHDAREGCQFLFGGEGRQLGLLTDAGHVTAHMVSVLRRCDALFLEANHDARMLLGGPYPLALKRRVGGDYGHLSNNQAAALLREIDCTRLQHLVAGHLSQQNNTADLARSVLAEAMDWDPDCVKLADQDLGHGWVEIE
jgi:phosphoribosyl 1,2-cyclic phosphodiesterase